LSDSPQIAVMGIAALNAILQEPDIAAPEDSAGGDVGFCRMRRGIGA
jgi:hypothetical protein